MKLRLGKSLSTWHSYLSFRNSYLEGFKRAHIGGSLNLIERVFLGTGGSVPTEGRNHPSIAIRHAGWNLLFDCGEDCQRQFERAQLGQNKKMAVFISHMHGDHVLGLGGLLLRFSLLGRIKPLDIYGPPELIEYVKVNQSTINLGTSFHTTVYAIEAGEIFKADNLSVRAFEVDHRGYALGYEITYARPTGEFMPEKAKKLGVPKGPLWGKLAKGENIQLENGTMITPDEVTGPSFPPIKIVYSGDTRPCQGLEQAVKGAKIAILEAMYSTEHADLAEERGHSTAAAAAELAKNAGVEHLFLTHFSPRYEDGYAILEEAREIFPATYLASDLMKVRLEYNGEFKIIPSG
ncbi:MAG: ribonuclease Z [Candidatus Hodarchaeota archaeon]